MNRLPKPKITNENMYVAHSTDWRGCPSRHQYLSTFSSRLIPYCTGIEEYRIVQQNGKFIVRQNSMALSYKPELSSEAFVTQNGKTIVAQTRSFPNIQNLPFERGRWLILSVSVAWYRLLS